MKLNKLMFREYDIRGIWNEDITEEISYYIGRAYATKLLSLKKNKMIVGYDNRLSSPIIEKNLVKGLTDGGVDVVRLGLVTTPMYYYAWDKLNIHCGIMITASHNPKEYNGFKMSYNGIHNCFGNEVAELYYIILNGIYSKGNGSITDANIKEDYIKMINSHINMGSNKLKVIYDCGNGTTSIIARELYSMFPIDLVMLYDESDGRFPNHHPDPIVEENVLDLKKKVKEVHADVGIGFDGDGDRAGFVDELGNVFSSDEYAVVMVRDMLKNETNKRILYDIKCSRIVKDEIVKLNGIPFENRTGASYMMSRVIDDNMDFGIEYSGHIYFNNEFPPITSGLYAGLKLLEIMSKTNKTVTELVSGVNKYYQTPELKFPFSDDIKRNVVDNIRRYSKEKQYNISEIDGIKVNFIDGWALVRCSNTGPNVTARFEATTEKRLEEIKNEFVSLLNSYKEG